MPKMKETATGEKVLLFVTALVGFLAVVLVIGMFLAAFFAPEDTDLTGIVDLISNAFLMLVGAIVGYIGGQGLSKIDEDEARAKRAAQPEEPYVEPPMTDVVIEEEQTDGH